MAFFRRLTGLERFWLAADRPDMPFVFNQIIEGEGELSEGPLRAALAKLVEAWPILRGRVGGALWSGGWRRGGAAPTVRIAPGGAWPTNGLLDAPALRGPLSPRRGSPTWRSWRRLDPRLALAATLPRSAAAPSHLTRSAVLTSRSCTPGCASRRRPRASRPRVCSR